MLTMRMETTQEMHTRLRKEFGFENYSWKDKKSVLPAKLALTERHKDEVSELIGNIIFSAFHGQESYQFVAHILSVFNRNVDDKLQAAAAVSMNSTYFDLWINPYMMFALTDNIEEIMSVMEHEVAHILYRHIPRAKDYMKSSNVEPLNWAMDCSINQQIPKIPNWTISLKTIEDIVGKKLDPNREFEFYYREMMADGKWQKFKESRKQKPCGDCGGSGKKQPKSQEYRDGFKDGVADYRKERDDKAGYQDGFTEQNDANLDDNRVNKDVQPDQNRTDAYQEGFERGKQDANKRDQQRGYDDGYDQQQQAGDEGQLPPENKSESYQDGFNQGAQDARDGKPKQEQSQQGDDQQSQQGQCDQSGDQQSGDQGQQSGSQGQNGQTGQQGQQSQQQGGQGRGDQAEQDYQQGKQDGYNAAKQAAEGKGQQGQDGQGQQGQGEGEGDSQGEGQQGHGEGGEGHGQGQGEPCPCCNGTGREGGAGGQPSPGQGMTAEELQQYMDMIRDSHGSWEESDDSQQMENFDDILREIVERAENKSRGTVPGHYQSLIEQLYQQPEVPWQKIFSQMVGAVKIPYRKTRLRKNRRQPQRNDLLGRLPDKTVKVCAAYDTSGSVSDEELKWGFNELFDILKCVKSDVTIIETDYHVQRTYQAKKASDVDLKPKGRGGTAFTPTFQWIKENNQKFDVIIYFTDGEGESRIEADRCGNPKVIWVVTRCKGDKAAREHLSCSDDKRFCHHVKGLYPGVTSSREK